MPLCECVPQWSFRIFLFLRFHDKLAQLHCIRLNILISPDERIMSLNYYILVALIGYKVKTTWAMFDTCAVMANHGCTEKEWVALFMYRIPWKSQAQVPSPGDSGDTKPVLLWTIRRGTTGRGASLAGAGRPRLVGNQACGRDVTGMGLAPFRKHCLGPGKTQYFADVRPLFWFAAGPERPIVPYRTRCSVCRLQVS